MPAIDLLTCIYSYFALARLKRYSLTDILLFFPSVAEHTHTLSSFVFGSKLCGRLPALALSPRPLHPKHQAQAERRRSSHTFLLLLGLVFFTTTTTRTHCYFPPSAPRPRLFHPLSPSSRESSSRSRPVGDIPARAPIPLLSRAASAQHRCMPARRRQP